MPVPITASGLTMSTARILGRTTAGTGAIEELTAGTSLVLAAESLDTIQDIRTSATPGFAGLNLGGGTYPSSDPVLVLSRAITGTGTNPHSYVESSTIDRGGLVGVNSYDAVPTFGGDEDYDHYSAFQARPIYGSTGTIDFIENFYSTAVINGPVDVYMGFESFSLSGSGTLNTGYGFRHRGLAKGTNRWSFYADADPCYFGGGHLGDLGVTGFLTVTDTNGGKGIKVLETNGTWTANLNLSTSATDNANLRNWLATINYTSPGEFNLFQSNTRGGDPYSGTARLRLSSDLFIPTGGIKTQAPSGGSISTWKTGEIANVSPTAPNRTVRLEVDGTVVYLHAKTTND